MVYQVDLKHKQFCFGSCEATGVIREISDTEFVVNGLGGVTVFDRVNGKARVGAQRYIAGQTEQLLQRSRSDHGVLGLFADHRDYSFTEYDCVKKRYSGSGGGKLKPETKF